MLSTSVVQPESTGTLKLASRDPDDAPLIDCNFLATGRDARRMLEGVKLARDSLVIRSSPPSPPER